MKNLKAIVVLFGLSVFALAGCNTMRGVGQDIEKGGEVIQKAASK